MGKQNQTVELLIGAGEDFWGSFRQQGDQISQS